MSTDSVFSLALLVLPSFLEESLLVFMLLFFFTLQAFKSETAGPRTRRNASRREPLVALPPLRKTYIPAISQLNTADFHTPRGDVRLPQWCIPTGRRARR